MLELRCTAKKWGQLLEPGSGTLEVKCNSRFCGAVTGAIILHEFNLSTGELVKTNKWKDPEERKAHAADHA